MSQDKYPLVHKNNSLLTIFLKSPRFAERTVQSQFVLDFDRGGDVIGVEIINLTNIAGSNVLTGCDWHAKRSDTGIHVSYDDEADAFYLNLSEGQSVKQGVVEGQILLDSDGSIISIECDRSLCETS